MNLTMPSPERLLACILLLAGGASGLEAQQAPVKDVQPSTQQGGYPASGPVETPAPDAGSVLLDRVVALINGDVILESDVLEEERFIQLEPFHPPAKGSARQQALDRLINRTLILQQMKEQQNPLQVSDADLQTQLEDLRKHLPACANGKCTGEGWQALLASHGFTVEQFTAKWRMRMLVLRFIEQRFRAGVRISKPEVQAYYTDYFVPQFQRRKLTPPPLATVSARIDEILLQQHVNGLLSEWLNSLKDQGSVAILDPQYEPLSRPASSDDAAAGEDDQ